MKNTKHTEMNDSSIEQDKSGKPLAIQTENPDFHRNYLRCRRRPPLSFPAPGLNRRSTLSSFPFMHKHDRLDMMTTPGMDGDMDDHSS